LSDRWIEVFFQLREQIETYPVSQKPAIFIRGVLAERDILLRQVLQQDLLGFV
jgi:hypothetical protein